jgi:hypothetical protein
MTDKEFQERSIQLEQLFAQFSADFNEWKAERLKAGGDEWPRIGDEGWICNHFGLTYKQTYTGTASDLAIKARKLWHRTEQAAREADEQIQFLRRAMTAGDLAPDETGYTFGVYNKGPDCEPWTTCVGFRKFSTIEARDAFIKSEGGIEVFRQKLAKGWPV